MNLSDEEIKSKYSIKDYRAFKINEIRRNRKFNEDSIKNYSYRPFDIRKLYYEKIKKNEKFNFELISDPDEKICKQYDVIKEKSMYGKKYMGIERSTFLIDSKGKLVNEWRKVKVTGHAKEVLEAAKLLKS